MDGERAQVVQGDVDFGSQCGLRVFETHVFPSIGRTAGTAGEYLD